MIRIIARHTASLVLNRPTNKIQFVRTFTSSASSSSPTPSSASSIPPLPVISILRLDHYRLPISTQLRIEEALLRSRHTAHRNFFVINHPPKEEKTIVMGLSNKTELLVHMDESERDNVQLLRRFSGGGTVFIDQNCFMATMIVNKTEEFDAPPPTVDKNGDFITPESQPLLFPISTPSTTNSTSNHIASSSSSLPGLVHPSTLECFPNRLMDWTKAFYKPVFNPPVPSSSSHSPMSEFNLTGSDYVFGSRKFGGNAQTITKRRWLHHTSFLWSLDSLPQISKYLQLPKKQPEYRQGRTHEEFLISLKDVWAEVEQHGGLNLMDADIDDMKYCETNQPSDADLFAKEFEPDFLNFDLSSHVFIPPELPTRMLWRLSHFFQLEFPSLDEIDEIVRQYEAEFPSGVKKLDYAAERERAKAAQAEADMKAQAQMKQKVASTSA